MQQLIVANKRFSRAPPPVNAAKTRSFYWAHHSAGLKADVYCAKVHSNKDLLLRTRLPLRAGVMHLITIALSVYV